MLTPAGLIDDWRQQWRALLTGDLSYTALRTHALQHCPWVPAAAELVATRMLVRGRDRVPMAVVRAGPFFCMGSHPANNLVLSGDGVQPLHVRATGGSPARRMVPQGFVFTHEDANGTTHVTWGDLGCASACTVLEWDCNGSWEVLSGDCCEVPTDRYLHLHVGGREYRITLLKVRVQALGDELDKDEWKTLAPVLARCVDPAPEVDPMANAYAHATRAFLDKVVGWNSVAGLRTMLHMVLFFNPPWGIRVITLVVEFCLDFHDAGAWLCLPLWPHNDWHTRLSQEAVLKHQWPIGTRGLFAPAIFNYTRPVGKGIAYPVQLWWVRPRSA